MPRPWWCGDESGCVSGCAAVIRRRRLMSQRLLLYATAPLRRPLPPSVPGPVYQWAETSHARALLMTAICRWRCTLHHGGWLVAADRVAKLIRLNVVVFGVIQLARSLSPSSSVVACTDDVGIFVSSSPCCLCAVIVPFALWKRKSQWTEIVLLRNWNWYGKQWNIKRNSMNEKTADRMEV